MSEGLGRCGAKVASSASHLSPTPPLSWHGAVELAALAQISVVLARRSPTEKLAPEIGANTCLVQKNNLVAVLAIFEVEFSYGLAPPFMELSVGKRWGQLPRGLSASLNATQGNLRTRSELASERYKEHRVAMS